MIKILFVCHGNICRSPMAEFILKDMVNKAGVADRFLIASAATSTEEIGNPVHRGTRQRLAREGISTEGKYARQMTKRDYEEFDYLIGMDRWNMKGMERITGTNGGGKLSLLLDLPTERERILQIRGIPETLRRLMTIFWRVVTV